MVGNPEHCEHLGRVSDRRNRGALPKKWHAPAAGTEAIHKSGDGVGTHTFNPQPHLSGVISERLRMLVIAVGAVPGDVHVRANCDDGDASTVRYCTIRLLLRLRYVSAMVAPHFCTAFAAHFGHPLAY